MRRSILPSLLPLAALLGLAACQRGAPEGWNGYVEAELTRVAAPLAGRLVALPAQRGASVAVGAPLFALERQQETDALAQAQAQVERADAVVRDLSQGQRPAELAAAQAALDAARAAQVQSEADLKRQRDLAARGFTSGANLDSLQARRDADAAHVRQLAAQLSQAKQGARSNALAAAQADARAAREAQDQVRWRVEQKSVPAPVAAQVDDTLYRVGEWVNAGAPVVVLREPGAVKLRFYVPEPARASLAPGTPVHVHCDGCGNGLTAMVSFIAAQPEYTPPVIYSRENRQRLVFLAEARPAAADAARLPPGLPVQVSLAALR
jgi:HlyD family secretion protein